MTAAERKVRERYPECEVAGFVRNATWAIFASREENAPEIGFGGTLADAWRDAASRLPDTPATGE